MVEQIRISPEEVRGYGNICEGHTLEDFIVSNSGLAKEKENVHGALTSVYRLVYSVYGLMFDFDKGNKQLYLQTAEADTLSFGFDTVNKQLYLVDENDTGFSLGFDEDTNELYITDDAPPIVHNYSIALDQSSYTTSGSLSVSATLLDNGVAVEGATVSFTGGDSAVTATTNSSGVATATVNFTSSGTLTASYSNVSDTATVTVQTYLYAPALDGTETLTQLSGTTTVSNGVLSGGAGYLATGWSNSVNYELTFEGLFESNDYSAICLYFNNPNSRDRNNIQILSSYEHRIAAHKGSTGYNRGTISTTTPNTWSTYKLRRTGSSFTLQIDNNTATTHTYDFTGSTYNNVNISIGVDTWDVGYGYGVAKIRNVRVTEITS